MQYLKLLAAGVVLSMLGACSGTLNPRPLAPTGQFATETKIAADGVKLVKPFLPKYRAMVFINTPETFAQRYNDFFVRNLTTTKQFELVARKPEIEQLVIQKKLASSVSNISDLIGLNQLQRQIGPFLVFEPRIEAKGGYRFDGRIKAIDPETGETVLHIEHTAFNWSGLDDPLLYPLLNAFLQWTKGERIATSEK